MLCVGMGASAAPAQAQGMPALVVDGGSRGGACSDLRPPAAVSPSTPWCSLDRALDVAPDGRLVLVRASDYPPATVKKRERAQRLTFKPYPGEQATLRGLTIEDSSNLRFEGFSMTGRTHILFGSHIELVGNEYSPQGITMRPSDHILIEDNDFHDLTYAGIQSGSGYGVAMIGGWNSPTRPQEITDVTIRGNRFSWIPADGIQAGRVRNLLIEDNEFDHVTPFLDPTQHSDGIQLHATADGVTVRRNYFHDQPRALIAKSAAFSELVIENNLMVRLNGIALNVYDAPGVRIVNNTIWDATTALRLGDLPEVAAEMTGAVVANNILCEMWATPNQMAVEDHNLIGVRNPEREYGPHDLFLPPLFAPAGQPDGELDWDSPAIDAADPTLAPETDRLHRLRVTASGQGVAASSPAPDIGAQEWGAEPMEEPGPPGPSVPPPGGQPPNAGAAAAPDVGTGGGKTAALSIGRVSRARSGRRVTIAVWAPAPMRALVRLRIARRGGGRMVVRRPARLRRGANRLRLGLPRRAVSLLSARAGRLRLRVSVSGRDASGALITASRAARVARR